MAIDIIARGMAGQAGAQVEELSDVVNNAYKSMFTFKGRVDVYSDLSNSGNSIGDMYYVTTDEGDNLAGAYVWEYNSEQNKAMWVYLGPISSFEFDDEPTEGSQNAVTSDGIKRYVDEHGGSVSSLIDHIRIEGEEEDLAIVNKRVTLPLATQQRAGMVQLGEEFDIDDNGKLILAKSEDGKLNFPENSIKFNSIYIPDGTAVIFEDYTGL